MAQSGIFVPANEGTEISVFENVYADIGDEQSIEQSLSTFSSHMTNIVDILKQADDKSLVLFDELAAGTDPIEGAALAMSILEDIHSRRTVCVATTHYSEIKAFALTHDGMENASMEFDVDKLAPTYRIFIGIPGKSNAFEISKRLGLSEGIIEDAKKFLKNEDVKFEDIISSAESQRRIAQQERALAEEARKELYELRDAAEREREKIARDSEKMKNKAREDAKRIVADAKYEAERIIVQLREVKKNADRSEIDRQIQSARDSIRGQEEKLADTITAKVDNSKPPKSVKAGDTVKVVSIDQKATVLSVNQKGDIQVQAGIMKLNVKLDDLRLIQENQEQKQLTRAKFEATKSVNLELDIRGYLVEDAIVEVDRYIFDAYLAGLREVNIIHGKGTGALRSGVQEFLKHHPKVKNFRLGAYGEGDAGVTVVTLKN